MLWTLDRELLVVDRKLYVVAYVLWVMWDVCVCH